MRDSTALPKEQRITQIQAPPVPPQLRQKAKERLAELVLQARTVLAPDFPMPTVSFDLRGTTGGKAFFGPGTCHVQLNAVLLRENEALFMDGVIPHELAHLVTRHLYGPKVRSHGPEWQRTVRKLGAEPKRCHAMDVSNAQVRKESTVRYACACQQVDVSIRRHNKIQRSKSALRLVCQKCSGVLRPVETKRESAPQRWRARQTPEPEIPNALTPRGSPPSPVPQAEVPPTVKQLSFANALAVKLGVSVPSDALASKSRMSAWISQALDKCQTAAGQ